MLNSSDLGSSALAQSSAQENEPNVLFRNVSLSPGFRPDPSKLHGLSGGAITASTKAGKATTETGPCNGFVDDRPDHELTLSSAFNYLNLRVRSTGDTMLLVKGPGGSWCNDNAAATPTATTTNINPAISGRWLPGTYQVWIGSKQQGEYLPYVLEITQSPVPIQP
ncbi:hypothetical protein H6F94_00865 [Leptolyngbya sp. FACHB-261]|nr:hypothetical protein [Leptolyngbya sp. FACHB-261]